MSSIDAIRRDLVRVSMPVLAAIAVVSTLAVLLGYPGAPLLWTLLVIPAGTGVGLVLVAPRDRGTWTAAGMILTVLTVAALQLAQPRPGGWLELVLLLAVAGVGVVAVGRVVRELLHAVERQSEEAIRLGAAVRQTAAELHEAEARSLTAQRAKDTFLANMSHELRTPLNAVMGYTELAIEELGEREHPEALRDLHRVESAARHLLGLIAGILELTQVSADNELEVSEVEVGTLIAEAIGIVRPELDRGGNELVVSGVVGAPLFATDAIRLRQIVVNLLSNAAKFTDDGTVTLTWAIDTDGLTVAIADTGPGIPASAVERIFERFEQLDPSTTRTRGGAGLGLAVTQRLVTQLDGVLEVESEEAVGTTFTIRVPSQ